MGALTSPRPRVMLLHCQWQPGERRWVVALNGKIAGGPWADPVQAVADCERIERAIRHKNPAAVLHTYVPPEAVEAVAAARRGD